MSDRATALWDALKGYAEQYAASMRRLPVDAQGQMWLQAAIREALVFDVIPEGAFEYYLRELNGMIAATRNAARSQKARTEMTTGTDRPGQ